MLKFILNHTKAISLVIALITVVSISQLPNIVIDTDPENMLAADHPDRLFHQQVKQTFNLNDAIVLGFVPNSPLFEPSKLSDIHAVTQHLMTLDHVVKHDVLGLSTVDHVTHLSPGEINFERLMKDAPDSLQHAKAIETATLDIPLFIDTIVSKNSDATLLFVPVEDKRYSYAVAESIRAFIATLPSSSEWYITGLPVAEDQFGTEMFIQMAISAPLAGLMIFAAMWLLFRHVTLIVAPMLVALATVLTTMAMLISMGFSVHIMSSMIAIFLMPIAVVDGVHVLSEFADRYRVGDDVNDVLTGVMASLFKPMALTSITSAAGFFSLLLTPIPPVQIFGAFIGLGIILAFLLTILVIPIYIAHLPTSKLASLPKHHRSKSRTNRIIASLSDIAINHKVLSLGLGLVAAGVSIIGLYQIEVNDNPVKWFKPNHEIRIADKRLNDKFGGTYNAYLVLRNTQQNATMSQLTPPSPPPSLSSWLSQIDPDIDLVSLLIEIEDYLFLSDSIEEAWLVSFAENVEKEKEKRQVLLKPQTLAAIEQLQRFLDAHHIVGKSNSVVDIVKLMNREMTSGQQTDYELPRSAHAASQLLLQYQSSHRPHDIWHYVTPQYDQGLIWLQLTSGDNNAMSEVKTAVEAYLLANPLPDQLEFSWAGKAYLNVVWQDNMVGGMADSLIGAFIVVLLMMIILFRSVLLGLFAMLPLSISIVGIYGVIGFVGKDYDMPIAVLSALTLGLSIDFAIHFIARAQSHLRSSNNINTTLAYMFTEPARAIVRNATVVAIGFTPLLFAPLVPYVTVGAFLAAIMMISAVVTLLLLPACLCIHHKVSLFRTGGKYEAI